MGIFETEIESRSYCPPAALNVLLVSKLLFLKKKKRKAEISKKKSFVNSIVFSSPVMYLGNKKLLNSIKIFPRRRTVVISVFQISKVPENQI